MGARSSKTAIARLLARQGVNPFIEMAKLAQLPDTPPAVQAQLWIQLARYCAPQLRAIEITERSVPLKADAIKQAQRDLFGIGENE